jgi:hypothetical protein
VHHNDFELPERCGFAGLLLEERPNDAVAPLPGGEVHEVAVSTGARSADTRAALAGFRAELSPVIDLTEHDA